MTAALRTEGTTPEDRLSLIMWVMVGSRGSIFSISRGVGMGSREQDAGFELKMTFLTRVEVQVPITPSLVVSHRLCQTLIS